MKKTTRKLLFVIVPVALLAACKPSLKISSDYDRNANFSAYKTYGMFYLVTSKNINRLNEERIWNSIREEMAKKGYTEDNRHPDILINAVTIIKDKRHLTSSGYGYGGPYRPYGYWGASGFSTVQSVESREGSLVIDIVDTKTNKMVWQGTGMAQFEKRPKDPAQVISTTVNKILTSFPESNQLVKH